MLKENKEVIKRLILSLIAIVLLVGAIYLVFYLLGWTKLTQEQLQDYIKSTGVVAPLVYILVTFAQVTLIPIPGAITILAGSYLFGFFGAFIYSYIGMLIGSFVSFALGRLIGKPYVNWVTGSQEKTEEWITKLQGREKVFLFFAFFLPFFPDDILCAVAGALPIKWLTFIIMQLITRFTSILGTMLFMSGEIIPFYGWGLIVLGVVGIILLAIFILSLKYSKQINDFFSNLIDKINKKNKEKIIK